jgi:hypothetical protein
MNADSGTDALTGQRDDPFHVERGPKQQGDNRDGAVEPWRVDLSE